MKVLIPNFHQKMKKTKQIFMILFQNKRNFDIGSWPFTTNPTGQLWYIKNIRANWDSD